MNAQTEQLIYWKQQADYYRDKYSQANEELDDTLETSAELEKHIASVEDLLKDIYSLLTLIKHDRNDGIHYMPYLTVRTIDEMSKRVRDAYYDNAYPTDA